MFYLDSYSEADQCISGIDSQNGVPDVTVSEDEIDNSQPSLPPKRPIKSKRWYDDNNTSDSENGMLLFKWSFRISCLH